MTYLKTANWLFLCSSKSKQKASGNVQLQFYLVHILLEPPNRFKGEQTLLIQPIQNSALFIKGIYNTPNLAKRNLCDLFQTLKTLAMIDKRENDFVFDFWIHRLILSFSIPESKNLVPGRSNRGASTGIHALRSIVQVPGF